MPCVAILHAQRCAEMTKTARKTDQAIFKCPKHVPARAATTNQSAVVPAKAYPPGKTNLKCPKVYVPAGAAKSGHLLNACYVRLYALRRQPSPPKASKQYTAYWLFGANVYVYFELYVQIFM
eukprot:4329488-Pleurochrysis_carterae.AAC.2